MIVTFPVGSTTTVLPGFAFSTDSLTLSCSSFVNLPGVTTGTFVSGNSTTNTGTLTFSLLPSSYVTSTVTSPVPSGMSPIIFLPIILSPVTAPVT